MGHVRQVLDIRHGHQGVGDGLTIDQGGIGPDIVGGILGVKVDEGRFHAPALQLVLEEVEALAIDNGRGHNVVARFHHRQDRGGDGRHAGGEHQSLLRAVAGGQDHGSRVGIGVAQAEVGVARGAFVADFVNGVN